MDRYTIFKNRMIQHYKTLVSPKFIYKLIDSTANIQAEILYTDVQTITYTLASYQILTFYKVVSKGDIQNIATCMTQALTNEKNP